MHAVSVDSPWLTMAKRFDKALEKATDSTLLEANWDAILECVDLIRGNEVPAKTAMTSIRKRIHAENPHSALHALHVLEACAKNCGARIHTEISTREFMEEFKNLGIESKAETVKNKVLELLQCWAMAFAARPEYKMVVDTHNLMKLAGFDFPSIKEADAMFAALVAPEWADGDECYRCRSAFGLLTRKHHCRSCGQIFCDRCSSQQMLLPHYGIEKPVRVCDTCYIKDIPKLENRGQPHPFTIKSEPTSAGGSKTEAQARAEAAERERQLQEKEEEELALALAISQSEQEAKEQERSRNLASQYNGSGGFQPAADSASLASFAPSDVTLGGGGGGGGYKGAAEEPVADLPADDPLARYLNRDYWQQKKEGGAVQGAPVKSDGPSAPLPSESSFNSVAGSAGATLVGTPPPQMAIQQQEVTSGLAPSDQAEEAEVNAFCASLKEQIDVMVNRIRSSTMRGRSIANDVGIQQLFLRLTEAHAGVLGRMNHIDAERSYLESLQDHVAHAAEARQAVDALREEHVNERRQREEERQRQKQQQMMTKLEMMRQKKHEMLLYQRHVALQKFQEQEMQARRGGGGGGGQAMQQQQPMPYYQQPQQQPGVAYPQQQPPPQYQAHAGYAGHPGQQPTHPQQYAMPQGAHVNGQTAGAPSASAGAMNGQQQQHYAYQQQQQYGQQYPQQHQQQQQYAQYSAPTEHHYAQPSQPAQPAQQQYQEPAQHAPTQQQQYPDQQQQHYQAPMQQQQQYQQPAAAAAAAPVAAPEVPVKEEMLISFD